MSEGDAGLEKPDALKVSLTGVYSLAVLGVSYRVALRRVEDRPRQSHDRGGALREHRGKGFYPSLIDYIMGASLPMEPEKRQVIALVYSGLDAIRKVRQSTGPTNPHVARDNAPGTIRALGTVVPIKDAEGNVGWRPHGQPGPCLG